jgi:cytochrome c oxidase assembly protein subunit 15
MLFLQLVYGAFMAGLKAANVAPTWPDINGDWIPSGLTSHSFIHHPINIHFVHRLLAYLLLAGILFWYLKARNITHNQHFNRYKRWPLLLVVVQLILGIVTVLVSPKQARNSLGLFEIMASAHQVVAMCLFMSLVWALFLTYKKSEAI